jgi:putative heme-binding domain-containing protein
LAGYPETHPEPEMRIAAFRAMRRAGRDWTGSAVRLAKDDHPAVRREVALAMRDQDFDFAREILLDVARGYDGNDRSYLEALGTGATGKEADIYRVIKNELGNDDSRAWTDAFADIAWRLHPAQAVADFGVRARSNSVPESERRQAMDALAFINTRSAVDEMITLALLETPLQGSAKWWLINRANNHWSKYDLMPILKEKGIYDPDNIEVQEITTPDPSNTITDLPPVSEIAKLSGDPVKGKTLAQRCIMCHQIDGTGVMVGPPLDGWGKGQTLEVIIRSIVDPSADIAHGFDGTSLTMKDGKQVDGLVYTRGNPTIITSMGGLTQTIPNQQIARKQKMTRSLMLSAGQLGLSAQDVADIAAFLKEN